MYTENDIALFTRNAMESLYLTIIIDKECITHSYRKLF